jgi:hypothetical protein
MQIHIEGRHAAIRPKLRERITQHLEEPTVSREGIAPASRHVTAQDPYSSRMAASRVLPVPQRVAGANEYSRIGKRVSAA